MRLIEEIKLGESKKLEFKRDFSKSFLKTVVAFANGAGGKIVFGVDKNKNIIGISDNKIFDLQDKIANLISDLCHPAIIPEIYIENIDGKLLVVVEIFPGAQKPYFLKEKGKKTAYIRVGATTRPASPELLRELEMQTFRIPYDEQPIYQYPLTDEDIIKITNSVQALLEKPITEADLFNLKIIKEERKNKYLTIGGELITSIKQLFDYAYIKCARIKGTSRGSTEFLDEKECRGPLHKQVEESLEFIKKHLEKKSVIEEIKRKDYYSIPLIAVREAILNAVVHRDYSITGSSIDIIIFDDRIEIVSPGGLPGHLDILLIKEGRSEIRNRVVARIFKELGYIEQWGTGIRRIIETYKKYGGKEPLFVDSGTFFKVVLYKLPDTAGILPDTAGILPDTAGKQEELIMSFIKKNGFITRKDVEKLLNIKERRARDILRKLVNQGLIEAVGKGKNRRYKLR